MEIKNMRPDMHKVVVERPRWNPGPGKNGRRANLPNELLPKFEGMRRPYSMRKGFTDLLGPLRRWLRAQVGRPWDDVYSEACSVIKPDSVIRAHIKTHLLEFVHRHTFIKNNEVWCFTNRWPSQELPLTAAASRWVPFYIHPLTRLLCEAQVQSRRRWRDEKRRNEKVTARWLNETTLLRQLDGFWFECQMEKFPQLFAKGDSPWRFDIAEKKMISRSGSENPYRGFYCVAKCQLSRRELRQFGVSNSNQPERSCQPAIVLAC
jgi:hypothetical protein